MARRPLRAVLSVVALAAGLVGAGAPAPLALVGPDGEPVALAPRDGRALVVHFWATWCPSCADELPELVRAGAACSDSVEVALVDVGDEAEAVRAFLAERGIAAIALRDPRGRTWRAEVGGGGLPANLIWRAGERRSELGPRSAERWRELFGSLGCAAPATAR